MKGNDILFANEDRLQGDRLYKGVRPVKVGKRLIGTLYQRLNGTYDFYSKGNTMVTYASFEEARADIVERFSEVEDE